VRQATADTLAALAAQVASAFLAGTTVKKRRAVAIAAVLEAKKLRARHVRAEVEADVRRHRLLQLTGHVVLVVVPHLLLVVGARHVPETRALARRVDHVASVERRVLRVVKCRLLATVFENAGRLGALFVRGRRLTRVGRCVRLFVVVKEYRGISEGVALHRLPVKMNQAHAAGRDRALDRALHTEQQAEHHWNHHYRKGVSPAKH
jgi:hypothetical protein